MNISLQLSPNYQNSIRCTEEGNHPKPRRTSHDLAHSTRLPKPPSCNLEWPRVTPIQVTLVTGPQPKHHIMTFIQSYVELLHSNQLCTQNRLARLSRRQAELGSKPPSGHLTLPCAKRLPKILSHRHRMAHLSRRQAQSSFQDFYYTIPPGETNPAARHHARTVVTTTVLGLDCLTGHPALPGAIPVALRYWFLAY